MQQTGLVAQWQRSRAGWMASGGTLDAELLQLVMQVGGSGALRAATQALRSAEKVKRAHAA
jgi:hypothetical protein